jgi:ribonuclease HII
MQPLSFNLNLCGIDEAGRGPFAGPMVIAGVKLHKPIKELNDSKKLTQIKREKLFNIIIKNSDYHIVFCSAEDIDTFGLSKCLKNSIIEIMSKVNASTYLMDGNTIFGIEDLLCKIKADATISEVAAASILAKVSRDRYMVDIAIKYPEYSFEKHKGYGTKAHTLAIKKFGLSKIHRKSFKIKALEDK